MAKVTNTVCDSCGKAIPEGKPHYQTSVLKFGSGLGGQFDLCSGCFPAALALKLRDEPRPRGRSSD